MIDTELINRFKHHAHEWGVAVESTFETESSLIAFGSRKGSPAPTRNPDCEEQDVVLKVIKRPGDEWHSGEILQAFNGCGLARVYEQAPGAVLVERLKPGNSLVSMSLNDQDEEATEILIDVVRQLASIELSSVPAILENCPTVQDWAKGFESYLDSGDRQIPRKLVEAGQKVYLDLCASQRRPALLHGDLQHYNVLFDTSRGWLAIDPRE